MSTDTEVVVQIAETPVKVTLDTGTPVITLTNLADPADVTVVEGAPVTVALADNQPIVNVTNGGGGTIIDKSKIMELLAGSMDVDIFAPELQDDIRLLKDLWLRTGRSIGDILLQFDVDTINQISQTYTDTQIQTTALSIAEVDGRITAAESALTQTSNQINLRVGELEVGTGESLTVQTAQLDVQAGQIQSSVARLDNLLSIDGTTGAVVEAVTSISQQSDRITQEVVARQSLADGAVAENTSRITQTAESLVINLQATDELTGKVSTAESRLTATEAVTTILQQELQESVYSLKSVESLTANSYGVVLEEDIGGVKYVAGFEMIIHPTWRASSDTPYYYAPGDVVTYIDTKVYRCTLFHVSDVTTSPGSVAAATYWEFIEDSSRSDFNISAEHFKVLSPNGLVPVFEVDTVTGAVIVNGVLKSGEYDVQDPAKSWYILDPSTGQATFNNITMTFGTGSASYTDFQEATGIAALQRSFDLSFESLQNQIDKSVSTWFYPGVPTLSNEPAVNWVTVEDKDAHIGDLYLDESTELSYRFKSVDGVYSWAVITDTGLAKAISDAAKAVEIADGKITSFGSQPTPPYGIGDFWAGGSEGDLQRCVVPKLAGESFSPFDWVLATGYTNNSVSIPSTVKIDGTGDALGIISQNVVDAKTAITDMASDGKLTGVEKSTWRRQWYGIEANFNSLLAYAGELGVDSTILATAQDNLHGYLEDTAKVWLEPNTTYTIIGTALTDKTTVYYAALQDITNSITARVQANAISEASAYADLINPGEVLLLWEGSVSLPTSTVMGLGTDWLFDSSYPGGVVIEVDLDDAFTGSIQVALNDENLTTDLFGSHDFGDVVSTSSSTFSDESGIDTFVDLSVGGKSYDLGGFS